MGSYGHFHFTENSTKPGVLTACREEDNYRPKGEAPLNPKGSPGGHGGVDEHVCAGPSHLATEEPRRSTILNLEHCPLNANARCLMTSFPFTMENGQRTAPESRVASTPPHKGVGGN
jgi:hypothetical protein